MGENRENQAARFRALTHLEQGKHLYNARRYEDALASFERAIADDPTLTRAFTARAHALTALGHPREAIAICDEVIAREPDFPYAHSTRGNALQALGRLAEARLSYERAAVLAPDDPLINYNFACYWALAGDEENCRRYLKRTLELDPRRNSMAATDNDFAAFREKEWFQELTAFKR